MDRGAWQAAVHGVTRVGHDRSDLAAAAAHSWPDIEETQNIASTKLIGRNQGRIPKMKLSNI